MADERIRANMQKNSERKKKYLTVFQSKVNAMDAKANFGIKPF